MEMKNGNPEKVLLIYDLDGSKIIEKAASVREFRDMFDDMPFLSGRKMRACIRNAVREGRVDAWLRNLGETRMADMLLNFADEGIDDYMRMFYISMDILFEGPKNSFADVVGLEEQKRVLLEHSDLPEKREEINRKYGRESCGNVILYGPPGCGKTFLAKALARETGRNFVQFEAHKFIHGNKPHKILNNLNRIGGGVVFLDEIEGISLDRDEMESSRMMTNRMLVVIDSLPKDSRLSIIGATNTPWKIDRSMLRHGRFDSLLYVGAPDFRARVELLKHYSRKLPMGKVDFEKIAEKMDFYSCSDIEHLCSVAASIPWREAIRGSGEREVFQEDFEKALLEVRSTMVPWLESASSSLSEFGLSMFPEMGKELKRFREKKVGPKAGAYG